MEYQVELCVQIKLGRNWRRDLLGADAEKYNVKMTYELNGIYTKRRFLMF